MPGLLGLFKTLHVLKWFVWIPRRQWNLRLVSNIVITNGVYMGDFIYINKRSSWQCISVLPLLYISIKGNPDSVYPYFLCYSSRTACDLPRPHPGQLVDGIWLQWPCRRFFRLPAQSIKCGHASVSFRVKSVWGPGSTSSVLLCW